MGQLLDGVVEGPAILALAGEPGIGKSTLWRAGVQAAEERGFALLASRPTQTEVRLSYAGLSDLLAGVDGPTFDALPPPQRRAVDAALLRGGEPSPDPRAVAAGLLTVLLELADRGPVLVAVDDVQWLDHPTHQVLSFAVRRSRGRIAVLTAHRAETGVARRPQDGGPSYGYGYDGYDGSRAVTLDQLHPPDDDRLTMLSIGPLGLSELRETVSHHTGRKLARPILSRIAEVSGGNPFYAIQLARSLPPDVEVGAAGVRALPDTLRDVVTDRLAGLGPNVRRVLEVAATLAAPRVELIAAALADLDTTRWLAQAEDAGVVEIGPAGEVRFVHPLLAAAISTDMATSGRRQLHRHLSQVVSDPEERARHLASSAIGPDQETIDALVQAASRARARGAASAAAELLVSAIEMGASDPILQVRAGQALLHSGAPDHAKRLLESAIADLAPGATRAEARAVLGAILLDAGASDDAIAHLEQAVDEAAAEPGLRGTVAMELGFTLFNTGRPHDGLDHALRAVEDAERAADDGLLAEALAVVVMVRLLLGHDVDEAMLARALELEDPARRSRPSNWPTLMAGLIHRYSHRLDEAQAAFAATRQRCLDQGSESDLWVASCHGVSTACAAGDLTTAREYVDELVEQARLVESSQTRARARGFQAELWAWTGEVERARAAAADALEGLTSGGETTYLLWVRSSWAMAELSVGDAEAAAELLTPAATAMASMGLGEAAACPFLPDAAEALISLGRVAEAEPIVESLEADGRRDGRAWAAAVGARCRALLLAAQGRRDEAGEAFEGALSAHDHLPQLRYDRARTLLVTGQHQRRSNQRRRARASLDEAATLFREVGCEQWATATDAELERLGVPVGEPGDPSLGRGELAGSGMTVREVASALIVSPKTVEAHLTRIYRKLGIRSRAELGRWAAQEAPASSPVEHPSPATARQM